MENHLFRWKLEADLTEIKVRLSIFTIISVCAGLPALAWSVSDLIHHRKNGHRISAFIILLLLTDFNELFLSPYILINLFLCEFSWYEDWVCRIFWALWLSSRLCGFLLNQLVALEGILSVKYPVYAASVFSSVYFRIFYILEFLCLIIGHIFLHFIYIFIVPLVLIASLITWIISCGASCSADRHSHTSRKPDQHILVIFILSLLLFYLPFIALNFYLYFTPTLPKLLTVWYCFIPIFLTSVRLISDPLLCVLVCRQNLRIQTSQNPEETSLV